MKKTVILLTAVILAGCGANTKAAIKESSSTNVMTEAGTTQVDKTEAVKIETDEKAVGEDSDIDYDLSIMGPDMVYATVYQMMVDPVTYVGKKFKVRGSYYSAYSEADGKYYHFCMIKDAAACCAQGLELLWKDEAMNMHENCPAEDEIVTIEGVYETYKDEGGKNTYGRIKDAVIIPNE